jgi:hypothetical protein
MVFSLFLDCIEILSFKKTAFKYTPMKYAALWLLLFCIDHFETLAQTTVIPIQADLIKGDAYGSKIKTESYGIMPLSANE